jgi:predicted Zn-dependent peptidase
MFQGSRPSRRWSLDKLISASGGVLNGSTRLDYTNYYEMLPSNALDRALFLEADRMGWPA